MGLIFVIFCFKYFLVFGLVKRNMSPGFNVLLKYISKSCSSVGMATDCGLDDAGSNPGVDGNFRLSGPVLDPTQPFINWNLTFWGK
jgi:hypothetical protein